MTSQKVVLQWKKIGMYWPKTSFLGWVCGVLKRKTLLPLLEGYEYDIYLLVALMYNHLFGLLMVFTPNKLCI